MKHFQQNEKIFLIVFLITLYFGCLIDLKAQDNSVLFLGNEDLAPILYFEDNENKGIVIDILKSMEKHMSFKMAIKLMNWNEAQKMVERNEADVLLQINISKERLALYDFSDELLKSEFTIFTSSERLDIRNLNDLNQMKVGVETDGQAQLILKTASAIKEVLYSDIKNAFIDLNKKK